MFMVLAMISYHSSQAEDTAEIGHAIFNTLLGGSTGCLVAWIGAYIASSSMIFHLQAILGGFISGCIAVSSIVSNVEAWEAFVVGFPGGLLDGRDRVDWLPKVWIEPDPR
jgi:ammonia channel protein AmtB